MCVFAKLGVGKKAGDWQKDKEQTSFNFFVAVVYKTVNIGHI